MSSPPFSSDETDEEKFRDIAEKSYELCASAANHITSIGELSFSSLSFEIRIRLFALCLCLVCFPSFAFSFFPKIEFFFLPLFFLLELKGGGEVKQDTICLSSLPDR